jgi:hypothetical protein
MTQLVVPGTQLQPKADGSNGTLVSMFLNFHCQNQPASLPRDRVTQKVKFVIDYAEVVAGALPFIREI